VKLTIVGCAGSYPGPDSAASCYLVEQEYQGGTYRVVLDLGNGALGGLQRVIGLEEIDLICLSHLHADHCFDVCSLYVASRYHPQGRRPVVPVLAPTGAAPYLATAYGAGDGHGMHEQFDFGEWVEGSPIEAGPFTISALLVDHPVPAYAVKLQANGSTLVYSGDTGPTRRLEDFVAGADVFLSEASFVDSAENPPHIHLTGSQAGEIATRAGVGRLLITHIPPWHDRAEVAADLKTTWDGPAELVSAGDVYDL
jgi:ribonuclease BN (tRNA processing enzyme)